MDAVDVERLLAITVEVRQLAERLGDAERAFQASFLDYVASLTMGDPERVEAIDELIRASIDEYAGYREFLCLVPLIDCELGRAAEAATAFDELAADDFSGLPRDSEWLFCVSILAEVAAHLGDTEGAAVLYRLLLPYESMFALASGEVSVGRVARYLGILAALAARWEGAARHFETALVLNARIEARPWVAHTQADYARMLRARGDPGDHDEARTLLTRTLATYEELGMPAAAAKASAARQALIAP